VGSAAMEILVALIVLVGSACSLPQGREALPLAQQGLEVANPAELLPAAPAAPSPVPRTNSFSADIARILAAAGAKPTAIDVDARSYGKRSAQVETGRINPFASSAQEAATSGGTAELRPEAAGSNHFSASIVRILAAAGTGPTPIDVDARSYGKRSAQPDTRYTNAHQYGLIEPKVEVVKVKSHGNYGKVAQSGKPRQARVLTEEAQFLNGPNKRRRRSDTYVFIPFSVYEGRRVNTLKLEENDFHALPARLQIELKRAQIARQAKSLRFVNTGRAQ